VGGRKLRHVDLNRWWDGDAEQRYWMEITQRPVPGENLLAPQRNGAGGEEWSYSLVSLVRPGDRVLHYLTNAEGGAAIVGWSEATAGPSEGTITWQARGTRGRARGYPTTGPSWFVPLDGLNELDAPVAGRDLGPLDAALFALRDELERRHGKPVYFPFFRYRPGEVRARQGYLTKFPAELLGLLPGLDVVRGSSGGNGEEQIAEDEQPRKTRVPRGRLTRVQDAELRSAIEQHAVNRAIQHYQDLGGLDFEELGKPYDLRLKLHGVERHVEVKGSSLLIETVELTINEVLHATDFQPTDLVVVDDITWTRQPDGSLLTSGGRLRRWPDWWPLDEDLAARRFAYYLPEQTPSS
jgi:hypothetical protein